MADYTEVTNESWFGRIGNSFKGIVGGIVLIAVAFMVLFWNEGRSVKRYKTLKEGSGAVVPVGSESVNAANDGKLVHLTGFAATDEILTDAVFGVSANALRLRREVEMFQWKETSKSKTQKKLGGGTEKVTNYTYQKVWSENLIDSSSFKRATDHRNPASMPFGSEGFAAESAKLGGFSLTSALVGKMSGFESLAPGSVPASLAKKAKLQGETIFVGNDATAPQVGDVRIRFSVVKPGNVSVVARQVGNTFEPYYSKSGGSILMLKPGTHSADSMFQEAKEGNKVLTWILRGVGFVLMFAGFSSILKPLSVIADVVPFIGSIVAAGSGLIAFVVAAVLSLVTIAVAWLVYRPVLGIGLLVAAAGLVFVLKGKLKKPSVS